MDTSAPYPARFTPRHLKGNCPQGRRSHPRVSPEGDGFYRHVKNILTVGWGHAPTGQLHRLRVWIVQKRYRFAANQPLNFRKSPVEACLHPTIDKIERFFDTPWHRKRQRGRRLFPPQTPAGSFSKTRAVRACVCGGFAVTYCYGNAYKLRKGRVILDQCGYIQHLGAADPC